jgi:hypothetical protein
MDKWRMVERTFMGISFISATISFLLNLHEGFTSYSWQLCVMMWVSISYLKQKMIEDHEDNKK